MSDDWLQHGHEMDGVELMPVLSSSGAIEPTAAGPSSPKREDFPAYVENGGETARGRHGVMVLQNKKDFTMKSLLEGIFEITFSHA